MSTLTRCDRENIGFLNDPAQRIIVDNSKIDFAEPRIEEGNASKNRLWLFEHSHAQWTEPLMWMSRKSVMEPTVQYVDPSRRPGGVDGGDGEITSAIGWKILNGESNA